MGEHHTKNRRHSKFEDLPPDIQDAVNRMLIENATYEEIDIWVKSKGYAWSKSGIGRHGKDFTESVRRLRIVQDQAKTLISEAGGDGLVLDEAGGKLMAETIIDILLTKDLTPGKVPGMAIGLATLINANVRREKFKLDIKNKMGKALKDVEKNMKSMTKEEMMKNLKEQYGLL
ncbi:MAG: DUF3486 family protein [Nitrospirae bacterium]|nr:DUF3486 family protein [Nitrospirota bacterium]